MTDRFNTIMAIMIATAFLGELKLYPFGDSFRVSLGIVAFFFGLLWFTSAPIGLTGILTGIFTVFFRVFNDVYMHGGLWMISLKNHLPSMFFYITFSFIISMLHIRKFSEHPVWMGAIGAFSDIASNYAELSVRYFMNGTSPFGWSALINVLLFGVLRSYFVVGLYNMISIRQVRALEKVRRRQWEHLMLLQADLYEESFYLRKSMAHMEEITRESYQLYKRLQQAGQDQSSRALRIAEHVHEIKKDSQRILAGLSKMIDAREMQKRISIDELCEMVTRANRKYAALLGKSVHIDYRCEMNLSTNQIYALLSVLNNLMANAVEAVTDSGSAQLLVELSGDDIVFNIMDTAPRIPDEDRELIFQPGYTTKYDSNGNPSTGIGLTHAQGIVHSLNGRIQIYDGDRGGNRFELRLPADQLLRKDVE